MLTLHRIGTNIRYATLHKEIGAAKIRPVTEIAPKAPFVILNSAGAKAFLYSLNIASDWDPYHQDCSRWSRHWAVRLSSMCCHVNLFSHHVRESGFRKFLLLKSGILGFGIRNTAQGIRNPTNNWNPESGIQVPMTTIWNLVTGTRNPRRGIQNPRLSQILLQGATVWSSSILHEDW